MSKYKKNERGKRKRKYKEKVQLESKIKSGIESLKTWKVMKSELSLVN